MSETVHCTHLEKDDVKLEGNCLSLTIGSHTTSFYLSEGAMNHLIRALSDEMYTSLSKDLKIAKAEIRALHTKLEAEGE